MTPEPLPTPEPPLTAIVYYLTFDQGRTVKIGTTTDPRTRFQALDKRADQPGQLLAAEPGHFKRERQLHARWKHLRLGREYFTVDNELAAHMERVREQRPDWATLPNRCNALTSDD